MESTDCVCVKVEVKVITQVAIDGVEVSVVEIEHMSAQKTTKSVHVSFLCSAFT